MGLASFFASFRATRQNDNAHTQQRSQGYHQASPSNAVRYEAKTSNKVVTALPTSSSGASSSMPANRDEWRKSRGENLSRPKSQHQKSKSRRSFFGGRPDAQEDVPAMPARVYGGQEFEMLPPGTAASTDSQASDHTNSKKRRFSIGRALSGKNKDDSKRKSWFSANRQTITAADLPPLPPIPVSVSQMNQPATAALPADKRRSRAASIRSQASTVKPGKKRRSFWASSNPDDSEDEEVPPVPSLIRDGTPDTQSTSDPFDDVDDRAAFAGVKGTTQRGDGTTQSRPISVRTVKTYKPKSAAKGFLKSTNGATDETRKSFRKSFNLEDTADMLCLTDEQRIEWAKLMERDRQLDAASQHSSNQVEEVEGKERFSNAQALAALEFGVSR